MATTKTGAEGPATDKRAAGKTTARKKTKTKKRAGADTSAGITKKPGRKKATKKAGHEAAAKKAPRQAAKKKSGREAAKKKSAGAVKSAGNKTQKTTLSVRSYLGAITDPARREDCETLAAMMEKIVGEPPRMWGSALVGFGEYHYVYDSGREGDSFLTGFSSRARNLTIYIMPGFGNYEDLMARLGPHTTGKSCLYVKRLADLHGPTLRKLIRESVRHMRRKYPA